MTILDMGNIDLAALEIFKTVAEQGGIAKAAARLHRVPSNVTTRVKQLEERLGTKLFHRGHRRLVLSTEGKRLLGYADRLLHLSSEAEAALGSGAPAGVPDRGSRGAPPRLDSRRSSPAITGGIRTCGSSW